jgi:hypothetical protein
MIIVEKCYSYSSGQMIEKLIDKLDRDGVEDYEVVNKPPTDVISIVPEQSKIKIYRTRRKSKKKKDNNKYNCWCN